MTLYQERDYVQLSPHSEFADDNYDYQIKAGRKAKITYVDEDCDYPLLCKQLSNHVENGYRDKDLLPWK